MKKIISTSLLSALLLFVDAASAQSTQNLVLEKVYMKWLVDSSTQLKDPSTFCWNLKDRILEGEDLPSLRVNTSGPRMRLVLDIEKTNPSCEFVNEEDAAWTVRANTAQSLELVFDAKLPFSRFALEDSRGRRVELLVEARFMELEESEFLNFFKDSVFSLRASAIRNEVWQIPFLLTKYELPTLLDGRLAMQIALGQSLFDFSGHGLRQGYYELGVATPVLGSRLLYGAPYSLRLRLAYEGVQINDQKSLGTYPLLASQMLGFGSEIYLKFSPVWGAQLNGSYYLSRTEGANLSKIASDGALSYALSERWRLEAGMKFVKQNISNLLTQEESGFREYTYFVGINIKPYLESR